MQQFIYSKNIVITGKPYEVKIQLSQLLMQFTTVNEVIEANLFSTVTTDTEKHFL